MIVLDINRDISLDDVIKVAKVEIPGTR